MVSFFEIKIIIININININMNTSVLKLFDGLKDFENLLESVSPANVFPKGQERDLLTNSLDVANESTLRRATNL